MNNNTETIDTKEYTIIEAIAVFYGLPISVIKKKLETQTA